MHTASMHHCYALLLAHIACNDGSTGVLLGMLGASGLKPNQSPCKRRYLADCVFRQYPDSSPEKDSIQVCDFCCRRSHGQYGRGEFRGLFYCTQCWNKWNVHSVPKARPAEQPPRGSRRRHFEVRNALTGEVIDVHPCSTRIDENTTVEWILPEVAAKLSWPASYVRLMVAQTVVVYTHRIRDRNQTFMKNLDPTAEVLTLEAMKMPRPEFFEEASDLCLCDFGGCCCYCMVPGPSVCNGCGNNGCCRSGNCGHGCCERYMEIGPQISKHQLVFQSRLPCACAAACRIQE